MTLFLRDDKNNSIVDLECWVKTEDEHSFVELSVSVDIMHYTRFLLDNLDRSMEIVVDFSEIDELRGWLWEVYFMDNNDPEKYGDVLAQLRKMLKTVADKYDLYYVED